MRGTERQSISVLHHKMTFDQKNDEYITSVPQAEDSEPESRMFKCKNIDIIVYITVIIFGIGSWVDINGLWVELPAMITEGLPEGWNLPSYLSVIIQIANIGPLLVTIIHLCAPGKLNNIGVVYVILGVGSLACLFLAFYWKTTAYVAGEERSIVLLVLQFFLALVDCTTSVVFLPFMVKFKSEYLTAYFIGEGMSGMVPSLVALGQGSGSVSCVNVSSTNTTTNITTYSVYPKSNPPNFPVRDFFLFLFAMVFSSGIAFTLLNYVPYYKKEYASDDEISETSDDSKFQSSYELTNGETQGRITFSDPSTIGSSTSKLVKQGTNAQSVDKSGILNDDIKITKIVQPISKSLYIYFLILTAFLNSLTNSVFPSIQTFSCMPYGISAYHLTAALYNISNPVACFIAMFYSASSSTVISFLSFLGSLVAAIILYTAAASPTPLLVGTQTGEALIITIWVVGGLLLTYSKVAIATVFRSQGQRALMWIGVMQQVGSFFGAVLFYLIINVWMMFKSAPYCPS
ncbi:solute carrier family 52, riboflavin transporter, member 3-A-like isoform X1 [Saccostrea echinata]|uniref:solute carrier family 52, riboflavin transporter, member 3-A-like isoform X1 n=1 Tax=Saccostrea echinata TaxID=191078 RepID=UPI002A82D31F|nr:solute carrier family 52, riboflavin transporter, member 3-A-like isoform X1 [Saccostrea echinata]